MDLKAKDWECTEHNACNLPNHLCSYPNCEKGLAERNIQNQVTNDAMGDMFKIAKGMKVLAPAERVRDSLLNLRDEMLDTTSILCDREHIIMKINSCLYSQYPIRKLNEDK
jgi:hypothetical protein